MGSREPEDDVRPGADRGTGADGDSVASGSRERPGSSPESAVPVSRLNAAARGLLENAISPLWVRGEVAGWTRVSSGHCYFQLRDEEAQVDCVLFRSDAERLPAHPEEGMEVRAFGQPTVYERSGRFQLVVRRVETGGDGLWRLAFEKLRRKLAAEGLLDPDRKRVLPTHPVRVGVVTSRTGAAVRDVVTVIRRRAPWTHVLVCDCRVQGDGAGREIRAALGRVARHSGVDVLILTRGGGSVEDLWCFNEEAVVRAVAESPVPVIAAVGHEVDVTLAELVADVRAPTPSAAAELAVPDGAELRRRVRRLGERLAAGLRSRTRRGEERALHAESRLLRGMRRRLERWEERLGRHGDRLEALSPLGTLRRGYAVARDEEGRVLRRVADFRPERPFRLRVQDGSVRARAEEVHPAEEIRPAVPEGSSEDAP